MGGFSHISHLFSHCERNPGWHIHAISLETLWMGLQKASFRFRLLAHLCRGPSFYSCTCPCAGAISTILPYQRKHVTKLLVYLAFLLVNWWEPLGGHDVLICIFLTGIGDKGAARSLRSPPARRSRLPQIPGICVPVQILFVEYFFLSEIKAN